MEQAKEIERKYLVQRIPDHLEAYPFHYIEQSYLCTEPVIRVRREDDTYYLTYKSKGLMVRDEVNLPLTKDSYLNLKQKSDGHMIKKKRYLIPLEGGLVAEVDFFSSPAEGLIMAEVEFTSEENALSFVPPYWFGKEVTLDERYQNNNMSLYGFQGDLAE